MTTEATNTGMIPSSIVRSLRAMQDSADTLAETARTIEARREDVLVQYRQAAREAAKAQGRTPNLVQDWISVLKLRVDVWLEKRIVVGTEMVIVVRPKGAALPDLTFALEILHLVSNLPLVGGWNGTPYLIRPEHESINPGLEKVFAKLNADR